MVIRIRKCESCGKLLKPSKLCTYQPRKGARVLILCLDCHTDFGYADKYIEKKLDEMDDEDE
jgi:RNase P subunit RPR2